MEIEFNQKDFIEFFQRNDLTCNSEELQAIRRISMNYNGLCDVICNHITQQDLLSDLKIFENYKDINDETMKKLIKFSKTHVLLTDRWEKFWQLILAIVFHYYPYSPLDWKDQKLATDARQQISGPVIEKMLQEMKPGDYYKCCHVERKFGIITGGHSTLIYKDANGTFTCFDPNSGAQVGMDINETKKWIIVVQRWCTQEIAIMDNKEFLASQHADFIDGIKYHIASQRAEGELQMC